MGEWGVSGGEHHFDRAAGEGEGQAAGCSGGGKSGKRVRGEGQWGVLSRV